MKERPILFSAPMVRALLAGTKTQTRRAVKLPHQNPLGHWEPTTFSGADARGVEHDEQAAIWHTRTGDTFACPYGVPGDRLWVRESILTPKAITDQLLRDGADTWPRCIYGADGSWYGRNDPIMSEADAAWECGDWKSRGWRGHPSIHMPRWACRIVLEITDVRVQRLQQCTEADAIAEGIIHSTLNDPRVEYQWLWDSINGAGAWAANPFVWALTFKRVQ